MTLYTRPLNLHRTPATTWSMGRWPFRALPTNTTHRARGRTPGPASTAHRAAPPVPSRRRIVIYVIIDWPQPQRRLRSQPPKIPGLRYIENQGLELVLGLALGLELVFPPSLCQASSLISYQLRTAIIAIDDYHSLRILIKFSSKV